MGKPQAFRSPTALIVWVVWLLFAVANWIDLAVQGRDHGSVVAAALLLLVTGIVYVAAQRPRVIADDAGLTIRNPLRDHRVGWAGVAKVDLADLLRVHCDGGAAKPRVISAWAVHYSRRRHFALEARARRPPRADPAAEAEARKVVRLLTTRAAAARAGTAAGPPVATAAAAAVPQTEPLTTTWNVRALAALVIPALILLIAWLL